jgi:ABC-type phosphate/phosphonate transport system substrate-binding protein
LRSATYTKIYDALYELAKSDFKAADVLAQNQFYPQAIYLYAQTFEKATKAVIAHYLMNYKKRSESETEKELRSIHGHRLLKLTIAMLKPFVDEDKELYIRRGGREADEFIQKPYRSLETLKSLKY